LNENASVLINAYDVGLCVDKELTDEEKFNFCTNIWSPVVGYKFPVIKHGNQNRSFQLDWLRKYHWLVSSRKVAFVNFVCFLLQQVVEEDVR